MPPALKQLHQLLTKGLQATAALWPPLQNAYRFLHQAQAILANPEQDTSERVRERYLSRLAQRRDAITSLGPLASAFEHFCHMTDNFAAGLFQCYDVEGLPRTHKELEHCFGVARVHERRATGRRGAIPGVVVRGSVRVIATLSSKQQLFSVEELPLAMLRVDATSGDSYSSGRKLVASSDASAKTRLPIWLPLKPACSSEVCRSAKK